jgi:hypothetical protein
MSRPSENTRDAIVKAAVRLFAEKGFQGTSVRDSLKGASISGDQLSFQEQGRAVPWGGAFCRDQLLDRTQPDAALPKPRAARAGVHRIPVKKGL